MTKIEFNPIGVLLSPYKQKFAIPRQPNLVKAGKAIVNLSSEFTDANSIRGIEQFSHLWLVFLFHGVAEQGWSPTVQPPRLGGKERVGVFASRSPFRPNPIGISVVENLGHSTNSGVTSIEVGGIDLLDGTPILDIKPYIPYADSISDALGGYAKEQPDNSLSVLFTPSAEEQLLELQESYPQLKEFISQILSQDPRPAWRAKDNDEKQYGMSLYDLNIKWKNENNGVSVLAINRNENQPQN
jgi:tRNA (adenine37-N6)-methyltransferase